MTQLVLPSVKDRKIENYSSIEYQRDILNALNCTVVHALMIDQWQCLHFTRISQTRTRSIFASCALVLIDCEWTACATHAYVLHVRTFAITEAWCRCTLVCAKNSPGRKTACEWAERVSELVCGSCATLCIKIPRKSIDIENNVYMIYLLREFTDVARNIALR